MTKLDILKLRAKFAEMKPFDLISQFPVLPLAPPGGSGPSTPSDIQEAQLAAQLQMVDLQKQALAGQQAAYILQQHFLELLTESCYQCILLAERFYAGFPPDPPVAVHHDEPAPAPPPAPVAEPKLEHEPAHHKPIAKALKAK
jgi:hypothetical protein